MSGVSGSIPAFFHSHLSKWSPANLRKSNRMFFVLESTYGTRPFPSLIVGSAPISSKYWTSSENPELEALMVINKDNLC